MRQVEVLRGDGLLLRVLDRRDAARIREACSDPLFRRWLPWLRGRFDASRAEEFAADFSRQNWLSGQPVWAICREDEPDVLLGVLDLRDRGQGAWEIGFWLFADQRGQGLMNTANQLAINAAFQRLGASRILHFARVGNNASRRVARNMGFVPEGVRRKYTDTGVERQWQHSLLKSEWLRQPWAGAVGGMQPSPPRPESLDGARPSELVAEWAELQPSGSREGRDGDVASAPRSQVDVARALADSVLAAFSVAADAGIDLEAALARKHANVLQRRS